MQQKPSNYKLSSKSENHRKKGFTLIELFMAVLALVIILLAVGHAMVYAWRGWQRNAMSVNMQRDATLAMEQIAREIRQSNINDITDDSDGIYFAPGVVRTNATDVLTSEIAVFPGVQIEDFDVTKDSAANEVTVSFTLFTDGNTDRNEYEITVMPRN